MTQLLDEFKSSLVTEYIKQTRDLKRLGMELTYIGKTLFGSKISQDLPTAAICK
jgi:hypothetical protein